MFQGTHISELGFPSSSKSKDKKELSKLHQTKPLIDQEDVDFLKSSTRSAAVRGIQTESIKKRAVNGKVANLLRRIRKCVEDQNFSAAKLVDLFLPLQFLERPEQVTIPLAEVVDVIQLDLIMPLQDDEQVIFRTSQDPRKLYFNLSLIYAL